MSTPQPQPATTTPLAAFYERERAAPMPLCAWFRVRGGQVHLLHDNTPGFSRLRQTHTMLTSVYRLPDHLGAPRDADIFVFGDDIPPEHQGVPAAAYSASPGSDVVSIPSCVMMGWPSDGVPPLDAWSSSWLRERDVPFQQRADILFWRGHASEYRQQCLAQLDRASPHVDAEASPPFVPMRDQNRYKYILDMQGIGWSARIMQLAWMGAVLFVADRDLHEPWFREYFTPWEHYVPVARDCSDAMATLRQVMARPDKGEAIARACRMRASQVLTELALLRMLARQLGVYKERHGLLPPLLPGPAGAPGGGAVFKVAVLNVQHTSTPAPQTV